MLVKREAEWKSSDITPENLFLGRRAFMAGAAALLGEMVGGRVPPLRYLVAQRGRQPAGCGEGQMPPNYRRRVGLLIGRVEDGAQYELRRSTVGPPVT